MKTFIKISEDTIINVNNVIKIIKTDIIITNYALFVNNLKKLFTNLHIYIILKMIIS